MTSTFTHEIKKLHSKILKFPSEEKKQQDNYFMLGPRMQKGLDTVMALTAALVGFKKETCVDANEERKRKSKLVQR